MGPKLVVSNEEEVQTGACDLACSAQPRIQSQPHFVKDGVAMQACCTDTIVKNVCNVATRKQTESATVLRGAEAVHVFSMLSSMMMLMQLMRNATQTPLTHLQYLSYTFHCHVK